MRYNLFFNRGLNKYIINNEIYIFQLNKLKYFTFNRVLNQYVIELKIFFYLLNELNHLSFCININFHKNTDFKMICIKTPN